MTYDLRRLRLHGVIHRLTHTHRYEVTPSGLRYALFFTRTYDRLLRPGLASVLPAEATAPSMLRECFRNLLAEMNISGNQLELWKRLVAVGNDPYAYSPLRTPTLVFEGVSFAGV